jgi:predicted MFS family arabinose efflux permease
MNPAMATRITRVAGTGSLVNTVHTSVINLGIVLGSAIGHYHRRWIWTRVTFVGWYAIGNSWSAFFARRPADLPDSPNNQLAGFLIAL